MTIITIVDDRPDVVIVIFVLFSVAAIVGLNALFKFTFPFLISTRLLARGRLYEIVDVLVSTLIFATGPLPESIDNTTTYFLSDDSLPAK